MIERMVPVRLRGVVVIDAVKRDVIRGSISMPKIQAGL